MMGAWSRLAVAAALLAMPGRSVPQSREQRPEWNRPLEPFRIVGNVHYVGTAELAAYLITDTAGHVLIDGAMPESADRIAANIRRLGFRLADVKLLLANHAHMDHAGGLRRIKALTGARLLASAGDRPELQSGRISYRDADDAWTFPAVVVDGPLRDGQRLRVGSTVLTTHLTPGHTRGCTSWTLRVRDGGRPLDVLFACSLSVAGQPLVADRRYPQAAADFTASFAKLRRLRADVFLNYHAGGFDLASKRARLIAGDRRAFVDRGETARRIAAAETAFVQELQRQRTAARVQ